MNTNSGSGGNATGHSVAAGAGGAAVGGNVETVIINPPANTNTTEAIRSNIPRQEVFFGREENRADIAKALAVENRTWAILIDGEGGIGKTALAIRAGHDAPVQDYPLKIFLSAKVRELRLWGEEKKENFSILNYQTLLLELGRELGEENLERIESGERAKALLRALNGKKALIIFDNVESLPENERILLFDLIAHLPNGCKTIVTSRRRRDESAVKYIRLDRLKKEDAIQYFTHLSENNPLLRRATPEELNALYENTGGNPLLIQWTAGQLGRRGSECRTVSEACDYLKKAPKNNDPLEYIFGDLLETFTDNETKALAALTYFTRPARVEWIAELAGLSKRATETALEDLTDRALVVADNEAKNFLLPQLAAHFIKSKRPEVVTQTGDVLCDKAFALAMENGYEHYDLYTILEEEWETIAAALPLFIKGENDRLQKVCIALDYFMDFSGRWDELLALSQQGEERAVAAKDFSNAGGRALDAGWVHFLRQEANEVLACAERCAEHFEKAKAGAFAKANAIRLRGFAHQVAKNYPEAKQAFSESLKIYREFNSEGIDVATALADIAESERLQGNYDESERDHEEALRIARKNRDDGGVATYTSNLSELALDREDWPKADRLAREALELAEKIGRQELIGADSRYLANALARQGKGAEGLPYAKKAVEIFSRLRVPDDLKKAEEALKECEGEDGQQI